MNGERLSQPNNCPKELYEMMIKCWKENPEERPLFRQLLSDLLLFSTTINAANAEIVHIDQREEPKLSVFLFHFDNISSLLFQISVIMKMPLKKRSLTMENIFIQISPL